MDLSIQIFNLMSEDFLKRLVGTWYGLLKPILTSNYFENLIIELNKEYKNKIIYPKRKNVFRAFHVTPYHSLKVVILGMDPYPNKMATGLSFSNPKDVTTLSPSLKKIARSIEKDYSNGLDLNFDHTLETWAKQGVLMLNTALTVVEGKSGSHLEIWNKFTKELLRRLSIYDPGLIYILWGKDAQSYKSCIDLVNNDIIEAEHPAYSVYQHRDWDFSFKKVDTLLLERYGESIIW